MASPWTKPTGRITLVAFAAIAEVFVVLAFLSAINDNFRRTAGGALNSVAVLIGGLRSVVEQTATQPTQQTATQPAQQQQSTAQPAQQQTATQPTQQQAAEQQLGDMSKGVKQLASSEMAVRLDGIRALAGVMKGSPEYHQRALEALCAFVRHRTNGPNIIDDKPATDVQAALTAIGRRKRGPGDVDLSSAVISGADLRFADLSMADLSGTVLMHADLSGANLMSANLMSANLWYADLSGADLSGADWGRSPFPASLGRTNLSGADLSDASNLTQQHLDGACGNAKVLPPGLHIDKQCPPVP